MHAIPESTLRAVPELRAALQLAMQDGSWLADCGKPRGWATVRPPPDGSLQDAAKRCVEVARARREQLEQAREKLRGDRRKNTKRAELNQQIWDAEDIVARLDKLVQETRKACRDLLALAACPVCSHADSEFEPRDHDCFAARCRTKGCEAQWELRHDPEIARRDPGTDRAAERRIPVFQPGDANPDEWPGDATPQWVDDVLGCDVLAVPVVRGGGSTEFLPPRTAPRSP